MKLAASSQNIELMAPDDAAISFFKSPFAAHDTGSAVDIAYGNFGSMACSPVDGEVVDIREYLTAIHVSSVKSNIVLEHGLHG